MAVEVFAGNTADPKTLGSQVKKVRERFGLSRVIFVGDRGMLTSARLREDFPEGAGLSWISALRTTDIRKLVAGPGFQPSLFDERDFAEVHSPKFPQERLIACRNPLLQAERARKREELLQATEKELAAIVQATKRSRKPLRGKDRIALRTGKVLNRFKVAKHFLLKITENTLTVTRNEKRIATEAALMGSTSSGQTCLKASSLAQDAIRSVQDLSTVERAFRSLQDR